MTKRTLIKTPQEQKGAAHLGHVNVVELRLAEIEIVREIKKEAFPQETTLLQTVKSNQERKGPMKKISPIQCLDSFMDENRILCVSGHIRPADLPFYEKHPLILPKKGHITELVIWHHHAKYHHQGRGITHSRIRLTGIGIINGHSAVGHYTSKCVKCQRQRGTLLNQEMADLYSRKRWRQVQHLANEFWQRWCKSYPQSLQNRQKWTTRHRDLQVDDVVILKDKNLPMNL